MSHHADTPSKTPDEPKAPRRANFVVGAAVVVLLVGSLIWLLAGGALASPSAESNLHALVHDSEGNVYALPLDQDATFEVATDAGRNVVQVEDGVVFVSEADCDNLDCVHQGSINAPGKQIICLPHKLWIEVTSESDDEGGHMDVNAANDGGEGEREDEGDSGHGDGEGEGEREDEGGFDDKGEGEREDEDEDESGFDAVSR